MNDSQPCIFCQIAAGDLESEMIAYRTDDVLFVPSLLQSPDIAPWSRSSTIADYTTCLSTSTFHC